ncbi:LysR family transcriptional regulator [Bradyrhizobium sp. CB1650]|uniref:LysR family transcriptional regulator n=1 Tax=Bradyrhizobium sp. CB1650 TaxID=3039153 RepID=UPI002435546E|nr:LysR family transcriptional regulator [Bradyrhizobium sp. CB1650]WGD48996.1 LysR family transcriptional regulator [Bradyrhizobium sp. CB1650]
MNIRDNVSDLAAFLAVARAGSFTRAAVQLGISQPTLSHLIGELEKRLGLRLLSRTTRSVSTTEAGERLLRTIAPHFDGIEAGLVALTELREKPSGTIRITTGDHQAETILMSAVDKILPDYPDLNIEISVNLGLVDIVAERFDAGVRLGETIAQDMIAVRIGPDMRMAVVGSPAYFAKRRVPRTPHDLAAHNCINLRFATHGGLYVWEFEKGGRPLNVRVEGQLIVNNIVLARRGALGGAGLAYVPLDYVEPYIASGELVRVLANWCEPFPGYHLYYPSQRQPTPAFALLVETLRYRG